DQRRFLLAGDARRPARGQGGTEIVDLRAAKLRVRIGRAGGSASLGEALAVEVHRPLAVADENRLALEFHPCPLPANCRSLVLFVPHSPRLTDIISPRQAIMPEEFGPNRASRGID